VRRRSLGGERVRPSLGLLDSIGSQKMTNTHIESTDMMNAINTTADTQLASCKPEPEGCYSLVRSHFLNASCLTAFNFGFQKPTGVGGPPIFPPLSDLSVCLSSWLFSSLEFCSSFVAIVRGGKAC